jgi:hypothetical protein
VGIIKIASALIAAFLKILLHLVASGSNRGPLEVFGMLQLAIAEDAVSSPTQVPSIGSYRIHHRVGHQTADAVSSIKSFLQPLESFILLTGFAVDGCDQGG